ncbi:OmpP1/FadL family transporter [Calditrichota bacterium LG25]
MLKKLFLMLLLPASVLLASGFSIYEQSARATGMAGAVIARADDPSAIFYNPAGISALQGWQLNTGTTLIQPEFGFTGPTNMDSRYFTRAQKGSFFPSTFYLTYQIKPGLTVGVGLYSPFGLASEWGTDSQPWVGRLLATKTELTSFAVNPVIAYRLGDNLSLALGFSVLQANVTMEKDIYFAPRMLYGHSRLEAGALGTGFNLGIQYTLFGRLHLGAQYRSGANLKFENGDAYFSFPQTTDAIINQEIASLFPAKTKGSAELNLPASYGLGIAFDFTKNLSFELDYLVQAWSSYDELKITFKDPVAGQTESVNPRHYQDSYSIRFGLEYRMENNFTVRAGYCWDQHAVPDEYVEPGLPESDRHNYTLGLGYRIHRVSIDLAYHLLLQDDREVSNTVHNFDGKYTGMANLYGLSVGYSF